MLLMESAVTYLVVIVTSLFLGLLIHYEYHYNRVRRKLKLSGPRPWPLVGNLPSFLGTPRRDVEREWAKKYGKIYVAFIAWDAKIICSDAEVCRDVCIAQFQNFRDHYDFTPTVLHEYRNDWMFYMRGNDWKELRNKIIGHFGWPKMRKFMPKIVGCADDFIASIKKQAKNLSLIDNNIESAKNNHKPKYLVNCQHTFAVYTFDTLTRCFYSIQLPSGGGSENSSASLQNMSARIFSGQQCSFFMSCLLLTMPRFIQYLTWQKKAEVDLYEEMVAGIRQFIKKRNINNTNVPMAKPSDYLQTLIDTMDPEVAKEIGQTKKTASSAAAANNSNSSSNDDSGLGKDGLVTNNEISTKEDNNKTPDDLSISYHRMMSNAILLQLDGVETASNGLANIVTALSFFPHVQQKLFKEIVDAKEKAKLAHLDFDTITKLPYLEAIIYEGLRMMSVAIAVDRWAEEDYYIEKYNVKLPKGSVVVPCLHAIHMDPDYWSKPDEFDPDRFMPDRRDKIVPGSFMPFGQGPRACLGYQFSMVGIKVLIAKLVSQFHIRPAPESKWPLELAPAVNFRKYLSLKIVLEPRDVEA